MAGPLATDEKFAKVAEAGFEGIECWLSEENEAEHLTTLKKHGLRLTLGHHPHSLADTKKVIAQAKRLGSDFIFAQPLDPYVPIKQAAVFCKDAVTMANEEGYSLFIETHRNNIPETLNQALQLIDEWPEIRFTADLSHFVVVGEFYGWKEEKAIERMMPVLERTSHAHGRISNGEQVQVDVSDGTGQTAQFFVDIWATIMRCWLKGAVLGDVFPFASELGPPRYAITTPDGKEFSDRWEQSLIMKKLAEQSWEKALRSR